MVENGLHLLVPHRFFETAYVAGVAVCFGGESFFEKCLRVFSYLSKLNRCGC